MVEARSWTQRLGSALTGADGERIQRLDEDGLPRVIAQNRSDRGDVALQHLWLKRHWLTVSSRNGENPTLPDDSTTAARLGHVERASISAFILVRWVAAG
jgi:hypothetical protein